MSTMSLVMQAAAMVHQKPTNIMAYDLSRFLLNEAIGFDSLNQAKARLSIHGQIEAELKRGGNPVPTLKFGLQSISTPEDSPLAPSYWGVTEDIFWPTSTNHQPIVEGWVTPIENSLEAILTVKMAFETDAGYWKVIQFQTQWPAL